MKRLFVLLAFVATSCLCIKLYGQTLLTGTIRNLTAKNEVTVNIPYDNWYYSQNTRKVDITASGTFTIQLPLKKEQTFFLDFDGKRLYLYGEPGKNLTIKWDANDLEGTISFGGTLGKENACWQKLGLTFYRLETQTWNDTLTPPAEILASLNKNKEKVMQKFPTLVMHTSSAFQRITKGNIIYFPTSKLWDILFTNRLLDTQTKTLVNLDLWRNALIEAYNSESLSNLEASEAFHYQQVVTYYPRYLKLQYTSKEDFVHMCESMFKKPFSELEQEIRRYGKRYFDYKVFNYTLTGFALERAIASFIINGIYLGDLTYLKEAYTIFISQFPESVYRGQVDENMKPYLKSLHKQPESSIEYINQYITLEEILAQHKGKLVYLDVWGSWCMPCRQEFTFSHSLKEKFKGKPVDFVYIAIEKRSDAEEKWKQTVRFYNLEGTHILASQPLAEQLRKLYEPTDHFQFPSYLLFDKSGKLVTKQAERPSSEEKLYKQINRLLVVD